MTTNLSEISIKRYAEYMLALTGTFDTKLDKIVACLAPILNKEIDELENTDISVIKSMVSEHKVEDELFELPPIENFTTSEGINYSVCKTDSSPLFIKKSEAIYLSKILKADSEDLYEKSKIMYENLHHIAAIIFRNEQENWKDEKFNEQKAVDLAMIFLEEMKAKHIIPYMAIIKEKFEVKNDVE